MELLDIYRAKDIHDGSQADPLYRTHDEMLRKIDEITIGDATWHCITFRYTGPVDANSAAWKKRSYTFYTRNVRTVLRNMLSNPAFNGRFDYVAYEEWKLGGEQIGSGWQEVYEHSVQSLSRSLSQCSCQSVA